MHPEEYIYLVFDDNYNPSYEQGKGRILKVMNPDEISSEPMAPISPTSSQLTPDYLRPYCEVGTAPISSSSYHNGCHKTKHTLPTPPPSPQTEKRFSLADELVVPKVIGAHTFQTYEDPDSYLIDHPFSQTPPSSDYCGIVRPTTIQRPLGPVQEAVDDLVTLVNALHKTSASNFHAAYERCEFYVHNTLQEVGPTYLISLNAERAKKSVRQTMLRKVQKQLDIIGEVLGVSHRIQQTVKPYHPQEKDITRARSSESSRTRSLLKTHAETEEKAAIMAEYSVLSRKLSKQIKNLAAVMKIQSYDSCSPAFESFSYLEMALENLKRPRTVASERSKQIILEKKFKAIEAYQLNTPEVGRKDRTIYLYELHNLRKLFLELSMRLSELAMLEQFAETYNSISFIVESAAFDQAYPPKAAPEIVRHRQHLMRRLRVITDACVREKERHIKLVKEFDRLTPLVGLKPSIPSEQAQDYLQQARHLIRVFELNYADLIFQ
ncbi:hypothetical protein TRVA0_002S04588 [Trichomonascus vanleenenianus]|uniref:uncharacterized protein n=1 Tax=Trichomonascus vanleenenianus TaxID=2268995 RepID=UPI003ECB05A9